MSIRISETEIELIDTSLDGTFAFGILVNRGRKGEWVAHIRGDEIRTEYNSAADGAEGNDVEMDILGDDIVETLHDDICHLVRGEIGSRRGRGGYGIQ